MLRFFQVMALSIVALTLVKAAVEQTQGLPGWWFWLCVACFGFGISLITKGDEE